MSAIGSLNETDLHAAVKERYAGPDDRLEVAVGGFVIDLVRGDGELVEVQTAHFGHLRAKLDALLPEHRVRVVYPVAAEKWIVKVSPEGEVLSRRKSPKAGRVEALFSQLVSIPQALAHPHFSLDVLLAQTEEVWRSHDRQGKRGWRRGGWATAAECAGLPHLHRLYPTGLSSAGRVAPSLYHGRAGKGIRAAPASGRAEAYCLREMGQIQMVGKRGNALLYE